MSAMRKKNVDTNSLSVRGMAVGVKSCARAKIGQRASQNKIGITDEEELASTPKQEVSKALAQLSLDKEKPSGYQGKPCFTSLPVELRHNIYSHILSEKDTTSIAEPSNTDVHNLQPFHLPLKYNTSLFRVSKDISRESLEYFHSQNVFVVVEVYSEWPLDVTSSCTLRFLRCFCQYSIPMATRGHGKEYALKIEIAYGEDGYGRARSFAVFSGHHLPIFMQLLNAVQISDPNRASNDPMNKITFFPATESKYYQGNSKAATCVQNAIAACRQGVLMPNGWCSYKIDIEIISGDGTGLTASQAANMKKAFLPTITREECLTFASVAKDKGDAFFESKKYMAVRQEYALTVCLLGHHMWGLDGSDTFRETPTTERRESRTFLIRILMEGARLAWKLGQQALAQAAADYAVGFDVDLVDENFAIDILIACGLMWADRGHLEVARGSLQDKLEYFPNNKRLEAAVSCVLRMQSLQAAGGNVATTSEELQNWLFD